MKLLNDLVHVIEGETLDAISSDMLSDIQKNIRDGAKDITQMWSNALELVHKAYKVAGVERPTPDMKNAWRQYEQNLQYGVAQLAKERGMNGDWRMSSAIFREAMERQIKFRVTEMGSDFSKSRTVVAKSLDDVIASIKNKSSGDFDVDVKMSTDGDNPKMATLSFSVFGIRKNYKVRIQQL